MTRTYNFKVDGYAVGDRLLEGVLFDITVSGDPDTALVVDDVAVSAQSREYFKRLNGELWLGRIWDHVEDILADLVGAGDAHEVLSDLNGDGTLEY